MVSHLTLPWEWVDCVDPENCCQLAHQNLAPQTLNGMPRAWVEELMDEENYEHKPLRLDFSHKRIDTEKALVVKNEHNQYHNENGHAVEWVSGAKEWYANGKLHRVDGPARELLDRSEWCLDGVKHRVDGPAVEYVDGTKEWWVNGLLHREDGPATEYPDGGTAWWFEGKMHRDDGPAVEYANGIKEWWVNGEFKRKHKTG